MTGHKEHEAPKGHHENHGEAPASQPAADLQKLLETKTKEAADLLDQLRRLAAEYSNYQKRIERHMQDEKALAVRGLVLDLLPVLDNFDRALAAAGDPANTKPVIEGMTLAHTQLMTALAKHGVTPVEAAGQTFDPEHHEAIVCLPSDEHCQGKVIEQMQRGYQLHGRTIRPARVAVSGGPARKSEESGQEERGDK
jgi:molecular chaperone GrpE